MMETTHPKLFTKHFVIHGRIPFPLASHKLKKKSARIVFINLQFKLLGVKHLIRLVDAVS